MSPIFSSPKQTVASSDPNFWPHSLQIHFNGLGLKTVTLQLAPSVGIAGATMKCDSLLRQGQTPRGNDDGQPTGLQMENCQEVPSSTGVWHHVRGPRPHQGPDDSRTSRAAPVRPRQRKTVTAQNTFKGLRGENSS